MKVDSFSSFERPNAEGTSYLTTELCGSDLIVFGWLRCYVVTNIVSVEIYADFPFPFPPKKYGKMVKCKMLYCGQHTLQ